MQAKTTLKAPAPGAPKGLLYSAVALSSVAALIHLLVTPEHFGEWWGYGTFMLGAFIAQAISAAALLVWPRWRLLLLAGVIGNLAIVGMWAVSRTVGIPLRRLPKRVSLAVGNRPELDLASRATNPETCRPVPRFAEGQPFRERL